MSKFFKNLALAGLSAAAGAIAMKKYLELAHAIEDECFDDDEDEQEEEESSKPGAVYSFHEGVYACDEKDASVPIFSITDDKKAVCLKPEVAKGHVLFEQDCMDKALLRRNLYHIIDLKESFVVMDCDMGVMEPGLQTALRKAGYDTRVLDLKHVSSSDVWDILGETCTGEDISLLVDSIFYQLDKNEIFLWLYGTECAEGLVNAIASRMLADKGQNLTLMHATCELARLCRSESELKTFPCTAPGATKESKAASKEFFNLSPNIRNLILSKIEDICNNILVKTTLGHALCAGDEDMRNLIDLTTFNKKPTALFIVTEGDEEEDMYGSHMFWSSLLVKYLLSNIASDDQGSVKVNLFLFNIDDMPIITYLMDDFEDYANCGVKFVLMTPDIVGDCALTIVPFMEAVFDMQGPDDAEEGDELEIFHPGQDAE